MQSEPSSIGLGQSMADGNLKASLRKSGVRPKREKDFKYFSHYNGMEEKGKGLGWISGKE